LPSITVRVRLVLPLAVLIVSAPLRAQQPEQQQSQQREHVVKRGDTLWDLARLYLANPFLWRSIYEANRQVVENPHWIYPAERLIIPPVLQQPQRGLLGDAVDQRADQTDDQSMARPVVPTPVEEPVSPGQPAVLATLDLRRSIIPVGEYLAAPWVSATAEREVLGRIAQPRDPAAADDKLAKTLHPTDLVYIGQLTGTRALVGDSLVVVRFGRGIGTRGRIVEPLAILRVDSVSPSTLMARIARQIGDARVGDAVLVLDRVPEIGAGQPESVTGGVEGQLLEFHAPEPLHGITDLAYISLGARDGVGIGDEFTVYVPARVAGGDPASPLPPTEIATMRVVKVGDTTSTVRVLTVSSTALRAGLPIRMIRKMP
jgi:LysM domain